MQLYDIMIMFIIIKIIIVDIINVIGTAQWNLTELGHRKNFSVASISPPPTWILFGWQNKRYRIVVPIILIFTSKWIVNRKVELIWAFCLNRMPKCSKIQFQSYIIKVKMFIAAQICTYIVYFEPHWWSFVDKVVELP